MSTILAFASEIKYHGFTLYITEHAGTFIAKAIKPFVTTKDGEPAVACYEFNVKSEYSKMLMTAQEGYAGIVGHLKHLVDVESPKAELPPGSTPAIHVEAGNPDHAEGWYHPSEAEDLIGPFPDDFNAIKGFVRHLQFLKASAGLKDVLGGGNTGLVLPSREIVKP
jgi:hypothetical protein